MKGCGQMSAGIDGVCDSAVGAEVDAEMTSQKNVIPESNREVETPLRRGGGYELLLPSPRRGEGEREGSRWYWLPMLPR